MSKKVNKAKTKPEKKTKKKVVKYKSIYTGRPLTIQQFLVESIYANNRIKDITKYIGGNAYRRKEYAKNISIISRLLKKVMAEILFEIISTKRVKKAEDLPWRVEKLNYLEELEDIPKDYSEKVDFIFDPGVDLRKKRKKKDIKNTLFGQIMEVKEDE